MIFGCTYRRRGLGAVLFLSALPLGAQQPTPTPADSTPGVQIVRAMHDRYAGKWFKTLTFIQTTTQRAPDSTTRTTTWYESVSVPNYLRIDIGDPSNGNGVLYTQDSVFRLRNGKIVFAAAQTNELVPLLFSVYAAPVERTVATLRNIGFDLRISHADTWQGRPVIVIGAQVGDLRTPQFWIDKERLVLVRQIQQVSRDDARLLDIQMSKYQPIGNSWIAPVVEIYFNGVLAQHETYSDIKADVPLPNELFDVTKWTTAPHWAKTTASATPKKQ